MLDAAECRERFHHLYGPGAPFTDAYLEPTPTVDVLARVLANLRAGYTRRGDKRLLAEVLRLRALLPERPPAEDGELAAALQAVGSVRRGRGRLRTGRGPRRRGPTGPASRPGPSACGPSSTERGRRPHLRCVT